MKIKFTEDVILSISDYNWGDEYPKVFKKDAVVEVLSIEDDRHGYKNIHLAYKEIAECVDGHAFVIV